MAFPDSVLREILGTLGAPGLVGSTPVVGIFRQPGQNLTLFGAEVSSDTPTFVMMNSDVVAYGIEVNSEISITGTDCTDCLVTDSKLLNSGFVRLSLTRN